MSMQFQFLHTLANGDDPSINRDQSSPFSFGHPSPPLSEIFSPPPRPPSLRPPAVCRHVRRRLPELPAAAGVHRPPGARPRRSHARPVDRTHSRACVHLAKCAPAAAA